MRTRQLLGLGLLAGLLLVPISAMADSHEEGPKPLTWLSYAMSQPGKGSALSRHIAEGGAKIYDSMMADGHILTWGVAMPINHRADDGWNVMEWVTFRDWAAVDVFMQKFMAMQMAKSPEEMKAEQEKWYSLIEPNSHYDEILRHLVVVPSAEPGRPAYYELSYFPVNMGQADGLKAMWEEYARPTMEGLQADGTVGAFGLAMTEVHDGSTPPSAIFWTALPGLGARDTMDAAFDKVDKERGEEANKEMMKKFASMVDFSGHHDRIFVVTHFGGAGGGEGEGGE